LGIKEINLLFADERNKSNGDLRAAIVVVVVVVVVAVVIVEVFGDVYFNRQTFPNKLPLESISV
jgi:hypothetical protein